MKFRVTCNYSSQWYDQADDSYVPESYDKTFIVEAVDEIAARKLADEEILRLNNEAMAGQTDEERRQNLFFGYLTHRFKSIEELKDETSDS